jgi:hypothetical protein
MQMPAAGTPQAPRSRPAWPQHPRHHQADVQVAARNEIGGRPRDDAGAMSGTARIAGVVREMRLSILETKRCQYDERYVVELPENLP